MSGEEYAPTQENVLRLQLTIAQLHVELRTLREVNAEQTEALVEANKLLQRSRPPRQAMSGDKRIWIAGQQRFKCAGDRNDDTSNCPLHKLGDGAFDSSGWECDHVERWSVSFRNVGNLRARCALCHFRKSREDRIQAGEDED